VALGPDLQDRRVVIGDHLTAAPGTQRRDRDRQGVVRVVLVRIAGLQQPDPGGQLGLHVQDPLPGGGELLGEQVTQAAGAFHRPGPLRPRRRPGDQLLSLSSRSADPQLTQRLFRQIDDHRRMRALVRVYPDHHCRHKHAPKSSSPGMDNVAGMPNYGSAIARTSSGPRHGETRQAGTSF
jgi:hypothetical protein